MKHDLPNENDYSFNIMYSEEDSCYIVTVKEFSELSAFRRM